MATSLYGHSSQGGTQVIIITLAALFPPYVNLPLFAHSELLRVRFAFATANCDSESSFTHATPGLGLLVG